MESTFIVLGFAVGALVAVSGVGGGALMTPALIAAGISPATAVGTDLMYAALIKTGAVCCYRRRRPVAWRYALLLAAGSLPVAVAVLGLMHFLRLPEGVYQAMITTALGIALVITGTGLLLQQRLTRSRPARRTPHWRALTVLAGMLVGLLVTLTSVGAGALGMLGLLTIYRDLPAQQLVAVDLAHAVPLTLLAAIGHWQLDHLNAGLLAAMLLGGLPGILAGVSIASHMPERALRRVIAVVLLAVGLYLAFRPLLAAGAGPF